MLTSTFCTPLPASLAVPEMDVRALRLVPLAGVLTAEVGAVVSWTVSTCEADVRPVAAAVSVGVPGVVSRYLKLAVLLPEAMVRLVIVAGSGVLRKTPVPDVVLRVTGLPLAPATGGLP